MAEPTQAQLDEAMAELMRELSTTGDPCSVRKNHWGPAAEATRAWIAANSASYNAALPVNVRNNATAKQKTLLFVKVALERFKAS